VSIDAATQISFLGREHYDIIIHCAYAGHFSHQNDIFWRGVFVEPFTRYIAEMWYVCVCKKIDWLIDPVLAFQLHNRLYSIECEDATGQWMGRYLEGSSCVLFEGTVIQQRMGQA